MKNVLRLLQGGVLITFALGAVVLAGCSATASEVDATTKATLTAAPTPNGGILACSAMHREKEGMDQVNSVILLSNDDDEGLIRIDRLLVYDYGGHVVCTVPNPLVLNPHQMGPLLTKPLVQAGAFQLTAAPSFVSSSTGLVKGTRAEP